MEIGTVYSVRSVFFMNYDLFERFGHRCPESPINASTNVGERQMCQEIFHCQIDKSGESFVLPFYESHGHVHQHPLCVPDTLTLQGKQRKANIVCYTGLNQYINMASEMLSSQHSKIYGVPKPCCFYSKYWDCISPAISLI